MKNRISVLLLLILFCAGCKKDFINQESTVQNASNASFAVNRKPNVIFILADDVGYENPAFDGGQSYVTPNLDLLASVSTRFTACHSSPICSPSRIALLTGKYNQRNYTRWGLLDSTQKTIANLFHDNGYTTCVAGKWQITGNDASIHSFGFDKYIIFDYTEDPFSEHGDDDVNHPRYFHPHVSSDSTKGKFWDSTFTNQFYGPDLYESYSEKFMDNAKTHQKPFFLYYSSALCHAPFCPTPLDAQFNAWIQNPFNKRASGNFYPSMMQYMDILIGKLLHHADSLGVLSNTYVVFVGDNGTPAGITSKWKNASGKIVSVQGGKGTTQETGTHVPLIIKGIGKGVDTGLVDFPDFMYSLADMAGIARPDTTVYGHLDAVSFMANAAQRRTWSYDAYPGVYATFWQYWSQTITRKVYINNSNLYSLDWPNPETAIPGNQQTLQDKSTKKMLNNILVLEQQ